MQFIRNSVRAASQVCANLQANPDISGPGVIIAFVAQAIFALILCGIHCFIHEKYHTKWANHRKLEHFNAALFKLMIDLTNVMVVLVLGLVVGSIVGRNELTAYHLRMTAYLANFSTYSIGLVHYFTWTVGSLRIGQQRQRWVYLLLLIVAWVVSIVLGLWSVQERFKEEARCISRSSDTSTTKDVIIQYVLVVQMGLLLIFAIVIDPWRERQLGQEGGGRILTWLRTTFKTKVKWALGTFIICGAGFIPSYRYYRIMVILSAIGFIIADIIFLVQLRFQFHDILGEEEDQWGMGQVLALMLFLVPIGEFIFSLRPLGDVEKTMQIYLPADYKQSRREDRADGLSEDDISIA